MKSEKVIRENLKKWKTLPKSDNVVIENLKQQIIAQYKWILEE
jgi:hypothetical protein